MEEKMLTFKTDLCELMISTHSTEKDSYRDDIGIKIHMHDSRSFHLLCGDYSLENPEH